MTTFFTNDWRRGFRQQCILERISATGERRERGELPVSRKKMTSLRDRISCLLMRSVSAMMMMTPQNYASCAAGWTTNDKGAGQGGATSNGGAQHNGLWRAEGREGGGEVDALKERLTRRILLIPFETIRRRRRRRVIVAFEEAHCGFLCRHYNNWRGRSSSADVRGYIIAPHLLLFNFFCFCAG